MTRIDKTLLIAGALGCIACVSGGNDLDGGTGPDRQVKASVTNKYAESLFTVSYSVFLPDGGTIAGDVMTDERIAANDTVTKDAFTAPEGSEMTWTVSGVSLGERRSFSPFTEVVGPLTRTCEFTYDYDLATAKFSLSHVCR